MLANIAIFSRDGLPVLFRSLHIISGITWIGLLYYFNLVQVPAFAAFGDEGRARNVAIDKLARKALWWFRWAAVSTFVMGIFITGSTKDYWKGFFSLGTNGKAAESSVILVGMILGTTMMLNVWGVIWRNQKVVLANAANLLAGGEADPKAAGAGRSAFLASRMNVIFSIPMLWCMVGASHLYPTDGSGVGTHFDVNSGGKVATFIIIVLAVSLVLELLALGFIGGKAATNKLLAIYEKPKNALITGTVFFIVVYVLSEILLRK
jgi:uncharacterized membrane protein